MDVFKKAFMIGIGAMALTKDKLDEFVDQAVSRGEMSRDDGKKFLDEAMEKADEQKQWLVTRIREETRRLVENAGFASKDELEALRVRLDSIESKLDRLVTPTPPPGVEEGGLKAPEI